MFSRFVGVSSIKVCVVVVLTETLFRELFSSVKLSAESQTGCARRVKVRMIVAL